MAARTKCKLYASLLQDLDESVSETDLEKIRKTLYSLKLVRPEFDGDFPTFSRVWEWLESPDSLFEPLCKYDTTVLETILSVALGDEHASASIIKDYRVEYAKTHLTEDQEKALLFLRELAGATRSGTI